MAEALHGTRDPVEDFLDWERRQELRYEFHDGEVRRLDGETAGHARVTSDLLVALHQRLRGSPHEPFGVSVKVRLPGGIFYPDVFIASSDLPGHLDVVDHAVVVAEVLSTKTYDLDQGRKWEAYRRLPSLQHYAVLPWDEVRVVLFTREGARWVLEETRGRNAALRLIHPTTLEIPLAEIYKRTSVPD